ncbi:unnamed protein product [Medioppia subpectinata]|uniref:C2H2-type domain-containing protein n=1 Tax=Medioppia subpectinata TaxID=1979941 RepID=A0A7R9QBB0_9ACAR|nr:unnamed protein product [Medioppia subpectinata]CAG2117181.1 unnamed protein product [Medioppia subpectinata]
MVPSVTTATDRGHYQAIKSHLNHNNNCNINNKSPYRIQRHRKHLRQLTRLTQLCRRLEAYRQRVTHHHIIMTSTVGNTTRAITTTAGTPIEAKVCKISVNNSVINNYNTSDSSNNRELKSQLKCFWPKCEFKTRARDSLKQHYSVHYKCKQFCCTVKGCDKVFKYKTNLVKHRASHRSPAGKPLGKARGNSANANARNVMSDADGIVHRDVADGPESSNDSNVFNSNNSNTNSNNECHKHHIPSSLALHALHSADSRSNSSDSVFAVKSDSGGATGAGGGGVTAHKSPAVNRWAAAGIGTAVGANRTTATLTPTVTNTTNAVTLRANGQSSAVPVVVTGRTRGGDSKFRCEYTGCGKLFGLKTQLIQHKSVVHLNQTLYSCDYPACDQMFNKKVNLKRHKNTVHLGLKPFSCDYQNCGKKFTQKTHLLQHRRRQHLDFGPSQPPKRFKCYYHMCNKSYDSIYDLKTHVVAAHIASSAGAAAPVMASGAEGVAAPVVDDKALTTCSEQNCNKSFKTFFNLYFHRKTEHQFIG